MNNKPLLDSCVGDRFCPIAKTGRELLAQLQALALIHPHLLDRPIEVHRSVEDPTDPEWTPVQLRLAFDHDQLVIE